MAFFNIFFFFFVKPSLSNAYPMNYGTEYVFFMRLCVRVYTYIISQVTPILNGFVPEVIFTTPTGKMIREKFGIPSYNSVCARACTNRGDGTVRPVGVGGRKGSRVETHNPRRMRLQR